MHWFSYTYWNEYLLYDLKWTKSFLHKIQVIICRSNNHSDKKIYNDSVSNNPYYTCTNCGEYLG